MSEQREFKTTDDFYAADVRRWTSESADYGSRWSDVSGTAWRVLYLRSTGEVCAVGRTPNGPVRVLGTVPADEPGEGREWHDALARRLGRYTDPGVTRGFSLAWIEERLAEPFVLCPPGTCPLGYAPGMESPCVLSRRCARPQERVEGPE